MEQIAATPNLIGAGIEAFGQANPKSREQIEQTAREFEGVFVSLLMKEMRNTIDEGGLFGGEASDSFGSLFDSFLGQHLADAQPLGIASLWLEQYESNQASSTSPSPSISTKA